MQQIRKLKASIRDFCRLNQIGFNDVSYKTTPLTAWVSSRCTRAFNGMYYEHKTVRAQRQTILYWQGESLEDVAYACREVRAAEDSRIIIYFFKSSHTV